VGKNTMKKNKPKVLVGTLKVEENEFERCQKVIANQSYEQFEHIVIEGLPNQEAHKKLFDVFLNTENDFNILVKVDADTVLKNTKSLKKIVKDFKENPKISHIGYPLHDFFTNRKIQALNCYRYDISLGKQDELYVDRFIQKPEERTLFMSNHVIGNHSPDPSDYQAFHFGFHRQLKNQYKVIFDTLIAYLYTLNYKRELALAGAMYVRRGRLGMEHNKTYHDEAIKEALEEIKNLSNIKRKATLLSSYLLQIPRYTWQFVKMINRKLRKAVSRYSRN
jgi:hypothetical protein